MMTTEELTNHWTMDVLEQFELHYESISMTWFVDYCLYDVIETTWSLMSHDAQMEMNDDLIDLFVVMNVETNDENDYYDAFDDSNGCVTVTVTVNDFVNVNDLIELYI
jgi:hypothetical protein